MLSGTVEDYIVEFEVFSSQCGQLPEAQFLGYFIGGLKPGIRSRIHTLKPQNRHQVMQMAPEVEVELKMMFNPEEDDYRRGRIWASGSDHSVKARLGFRPKVSEELKSNVNTHSLSGVSSGSSSGYAGGGFSGSLVRSRPSGGLGSTSSTASNNRAGTTSVSEQEMTARRHDSERRGVFEKNRGVQHLPYSELLERRAKGLCFRCNEKFTPSHRCSGQLHLLVLADNETVDERGEIVALEAEDVKDDGSMECKPLGMLGVHDASTKGAKTMRIAGIINGISLLVLINIGASHNFIAPSVVSALNLWVDESKNLGVRFGDGHRVWAIATAIE